MDETSEFDFKVKEYEEIIKKLKDDNTQLSNLILKTSTNDQTFDKLKKIYGDIL